MTAWALFCHDFDLSKGINILSEKCPVVLDHYMYYFLLDYFSESVIAWWAILILGAAAMYALPLMLLSAASQMISASA